MTLAVQLTQMTGATESFVKLLDESVDVWRPTQAEHLSGNTYRILDQLYDRDLEAWSFSPGDEVECEMTDSNDGQILAAGKLASMD